MQTTFQRHHFRLPSTALTSISLLVGTALGGCGGGSGDIVTQTSAGYQVESGVVQKGPLTRGSWISVNELNATTLAPLGTSYNFEIRDDYGTFQPSAAVFKQKLLESTATGYYLDELTGQVSTDMVTLRGMSDLSVDRAINVNLLTDLSNARIRALMAQTAAPLGFQAARTQAQREVLAAFNLHNSAELLAGGNQPAAFGELDLSKNRNADQVLTALSAVITQIGVTGGGITQFINQFESDLADDGLLNNSPKFTVPLNTQLDNAYKQVDFDRLAVNLNQFYNTNRYDADALARWVDTSGGTDKVVDRFKTESGNVVANAENRSPLYVAGSEDHGQCLSSSTGKLYYNGNLVTTATVKAVKGESYSIGLSGTTAQALVDGYLQRTAPVASVCPTKAPTTGITRLAKHSVTIAGVTNPKTVLDLYENYLPDDKKNSTLYVLRGDGSVWYWNADTRGIPTLLYKDINIAGFLPNRDRQLQIVMKNGTTGTVLPRYSAKLGRNTADVTKHLNRQLCTTGQPENSSVALKKDGRVWVKGSNAHGQLGDGTTFSVNTEKPIGTHFASIVCLGRYAGHSAPPAILALKKDGSLVAWGGNTSGVLGDGTTTDVLTPKVIATGVTSVQAHGTSALALKLDGTLWSWGTNATVQADGSTQTAGILGNGSNAHSLRPQKIGSEFQSFALIAGDRVVATKTSGALWTWGSHAAALIGSTGHLYSPMALDPNFVTLQGDEATASGASNIAFGFKKDGSTWGWSANVHGQLGDGTTTPGTTTPVRIGTGFRKLYAQGDHVFGIKTDGTLWAWGSNAWAQFGDGTTSHSLIPRQIVLP